MQAFAEREGRPPRILIAKLGQDGHDRGAKLIATGLADAGFDVDLGPLFSTPEEVARIALDNDVHVVGISTQAGAHTTLVPELTQLLREAAGSAGPLVVCGGIVPQEHHEQLVEAGVAALFEPGTPVPVIAARIVELLVAARDRDGST